MLKPRFFGHFQVLHPVGKQTYKLKLPKKWRIHDFFHVWLLEQNTTNKGQVNDTQLDFEIEIGNNNKYKVDGIWNNAIYARELAIEQLPRLYYLVLLKGYSEDGNTWGPASAIQHFRKLVITYHNDNSKKLIATSAFVDIASPMTRPIAHILIKQKWGQPVGFTTTIKQAKKS